MSWQLCLIWFVSHIDATTHYHYLCSYLLLGLCKHSASVDKWHLYVESFNLYYHTTNICFQHCKTIKQSSITFEAIFLCGTWALFHLWQKVISNVGDDRKKMSCRPKLVLSKSFIIFPASVTVFVGINRRLYFLSIPDIYEVW